MRVNQDVMTDRMFYALAHPSQNSRFYLALVFSMILFPLIATALILGTIFFIVPLIALLVWISSRVMFARMLGNSILVSSLNYPRVQILAEQLKVKMGYHKPVYIFVYEQGDFNAYMRYFFFRRAIFLNSELLETGVSDDEVCWLVGRFIGYMRARQQAGVLGWVIRAAQYLVVFNVFLLPYERAMVYTGDRLAVAAIDGDILSAISATQKLLVGRELGYSVNPEGIIAQQREVKGSVFAFLARLPSNFPHVTSRYVDMIAFSKAFFPAQFARFQAANPGLPEDLPELAAAHQPMPPQGGLEAAARPPHGWICATSTAGVLLALGLITWNNLPSGDNYADQRDVDFETGSDASFAPEPDISIPAEPASIDPAEVPADPSLEAQPLNIHVNAAGEWEPDDGCDWLTDDPDDLRVTCN